MKIRNLLLPILCTTLYSVNAQTSMDATIFGFENFDGPFDSVQSVDGDFFFQTRSHFQGSDAITPGPTGNVDNKSLKFETTNYNDDVLANDGTPIGSNTALIQTVSGSNNNLDDGCYTFTASVYIPSMYDNGDGGGLRTNQAPSKFSFRQFNATPFAVSADISLVTQRDQWVQVTAAASTTASNISDSRFIVGITESDFPTTDRENGGILYIDDINVTLVATVPCDDPTLSTSEFTAVESKSVFPNPATNNVTVSSIANGNIEIINLLGQVVYNTNSPSNETVLDISSIPSGTYFVKISSKTNESFIEKLIIK